MILQQRIIKESPRSTVSTLSIDGEEFAFILEDGYNFPKVMRETRIPHGVYEVVPRRDGRHYTKYSAKWGHEFTLWVRHIPNFSWVMIHIGNFYQDTYGCPLIGSAWTRYRDDYAVSASTRAYKRLYKTLEPLFRRESMSFSEKVVLVVDRSRSAYEKREPIRTDKIIMNR